MRAIWKGEIIAESDDTVVVEGNHYFPKKDVNFNYLNESHENYYCPWKGEAKYYNIEIDGKINENAAWIYPDPKPAAKMIKDRIAFWRGVEVI